MLIAQRIENLQHMIGGHVQDHELPIVVEPIVKSEIAEIHPPETIASYGRAELQDLMRAHGRTMFDGDTRHCVVCASNCR
jgi:hypothetical protein